MIIDSYRFASAPPPPTGHRYWGVYITASDGGSFKGMTELQLRGTVGGADMTDPTQAFTGNFAFSTDNINGSNSQEKAFDDNTSSGWLSGSNGLPKRIWWDFAGNGSLPGTTADVAQISIAGSWNDPPSSPKDFEIQWSDDAVSWTTVKTVTGETGWTGASDVRVFTI